MWNNGLQVTGRQVMKSAELCGDSVYLRGFPGNRSQVERADSLSDGGGAGRWGDLGE